MLQSALVWCKDRRQQFLWLRCLSRCNWGVSRRVLVWPQGQALNCQGHPPPHLAVLQSALSGAGPGESTSSGCGASPDATGESAGSACMASGPGAELSGTPTSASGGVVSALVWCRARGTTVPLAAVPLQVQLGSQQEVLVWPQCQALNCQGHPPLHLAVLQSALSGAGPGDNSSSGLRCLSRCNWGVSREVLVWPQGQALNCQGHPPLHLAVLQ